MLAGVDGCRAGWVAAVEERGRVSVRRFELHELERFDAVAIDMPIGLLEAGPRACDRAARRLLGPRRSSVFPAPPRALLAATEPQGMRQAWNLLPKIRALDAAMTPALQGRVREAHPELCFARLAGAPLRHPKKSAAGRRERLRALRGHLPPAVLAARVEGAAPDDVLDACALLTAARRIAAGNAEGLGAEVDARGLRCEIWF